MNSVQYIQLQHKLYSTPLVYKKTKKRPGLFFFFTALGLTAIAEAPDLLKVKYFTKQIEN